MKFGIIVFPGSNCDTDCFHVVQTVFNKPARYVWHRETDITDLDVIILPGGFSYGDYLRCGAIAKFSPVMKEIVSHAQKGKPVLGICNGFQILVEAGLLPGALMRNEGLKFICESVSLRLVTTRIPFTRKGISGADYQMPIAHMEGNYFIDGEGLKSLREHDQIVFEYEGSNPNGALANIAGICNRKGNVLGMMPHPERVSEAILGGTDGRFIFESLLS